ncbi:unnamed protein product [Calypogeia fissa]
MTVTNSPPPPPPQTCNITNEQQPKKKQELKSRVQLVSQCNGVTSATEKSISSMGADEWELVNDDGFIYKRRKRKADVSSAATLTKTQEPVLSEKTQPLDGEALSRQKKMAMLLAQKEMYAAETADWERILKKQEDPVASTPIFQSPTSPEQVSVPSVEPEQVSVHSVEPEQVSVHSVEPEQVSVHNVEPEQASVHSVDDATTNDSLQILQLQVEAYEGFVEQLKRVRDQGESLCKKLEMGVEAGRIHVEHDMFKEVVKFTPRTIIHSLTSDPAVLLPLPVADLPEKTLLGRLLANDGDDGSHVQKDR